MEAIDEPYKATKMWTELVQLFKNGIPRKRHWKHVKFHDSSFTGGEAIQWFHKTLQNHSRFGTGVTKEQTVQLLSKFLKAGIFRDVTSCHKKDVLKLGHVYIFNKEGFDNAAVAHSTEVNGLLSSYRVKKVPKKFGRSDVKMNEHALQNKADTLLPSDKNFSGPFLLFDDKCYKPYSEEDQIYNSHKLKSPSPNVTSLKSRRALIDVLNTDFSSQDSHSYVCQKSLGFNSKHTFPILDRSAKRPDTRSISYSERYTSDMPKPVFNSPGINVNKELLPCGSSTAINYNANHISANDILHSVMIRLRRLLDRNLVINELFSIPADWIAINLRKNLICLSYKETVFPQTVFSVLNRNVEDVAVFPEEDMNIIVNFLLVVAAPLMSLELFRCIVKLFTFLCNTANQKDTAVLSSHASYSFENLILEMTHSGNHFSDEKEETTTNILSSVPPPNYCFETAFTSDNPVTRIIPQSSVDSVHLFPKQPEFQRKRHGFHSDNNSYSCDSRRKMKGNCNRPLSSNFSETVKLSNSGGYVNLALSYSMDDLNDEDLTRHEMDYDAALKTLKTLTDFLQNESQNDPNIEDQFYANTHFSVRNNDLSGSESSFHTACSTPDHSKFIGDSTEYILGSEERDDMASKALQLLMLFLQPTNFVSVYTILRYMAQVHQYQLFKDQVVNLLSKILLSGHSEDEYNISTVNKISQFMLLYYQTLFSPLSDLESDFKHEAAKQEEEEYSFCQQVSGKQFEEHKQSTSQKDIPELLDAILQDKSISSKERKRWLKLFSVSYPSIYHSRFASENISSKNGSKNIKKFHLSNNSGRLRM